MDKYAVMDLIGEGSFGRVFRGKNKQTGEIVALKLIPKVGHSDKDIQSLRSECKIQKELNHPNIVRMIDAFETDKLIERTCTQCQKEFTNKSVLARHIKTVHEQERPFKCDHCLKHFFNNNQLQVKSLYMSHTVSYLY